VIRDYRRWPGVVRPVGSQDGSRHAGHHQVMLPPNLSPPQQRERSGPWPIPGEPRTLLQPNSTARGSCISRTSATICPTPLHAGDPYRAGVRAIPNPGLITLREPGAPTRTIRLFVRGGYVDRLVVCVQIIRYSALPDPSDGCLTGRLCAPFSASPGRAATGWAWLVIMLLIVGGFSRSLRHGHGCGLTVAGRGLGRGSASRAVWGGR
jgi:hypothetical protein